MSYIFPLLTSLEQKDLNYVENEVFSRIVLMCQIAFSGVDDSS